MAQATDKPPVKTPVQPPRPEYDDDGTVVLERTTEKTKPPQMYQVVLLNDDYTPMEFVVFAIMEFFGKDKDTAIAIMLKIHIEGRGVCGVFTKDVAATKASTVMEAAQNAGHPLQAVSEPID